MNAAAKTTPLKSGPALRAVLTAIIDDGLAFAQDRFFSDDTTTRIEFFLNQRLWSLVLPWPPGKQIGKLDPGSGIDALAAQSRHGQLLDEDEVYRRSGLVDYARRGHKALASGAAHGTLVMDLACNAPASFRPPVAGWRPIVAVQLPSATVADTSGASLGVHLYFALLYIIVQAELIAAQGSGPLPVVVNISYGRTAGPHDGSSLFEAALDELIHSCNTDSALPFRVVLPAGNNRLSRCHACFTLPPHRSHDLHWRVLPDDRSESQVQIWLPAGVDTSKLSVTVTAPDDSGTGTVFGGQGATLRIDGRVIAMLLYEQPAFSNGRSRVTLFIAPTAWVDVLLPLAPAGLWRITFENHPGAAQATDIHAWIQRDDTAPGHPRRGRQSYFDDPAYACFDDGGRAIEDDQHALTRASCVKRDGTLNAIATGMEPIVIGGFRRSDGEPAPYSASGPALAPAGAAVPNRDGPDALLPSDDGPSQRGLLGAGTRSNSCFAMHGTSVAAPLAAGLLAEWMAASKPSDRQAIYNHASQNDVGTGTKPPKTRGGGGRIARPANRPPRLP